MTSTLSDAIAAVRAGEPERAQLLAAEVVRDNPNDPNGWYLLSQLVESDARRAAYLGKTLAIDPDHPRARAEFAALPPSLVGELAAPLQPVEAGAPSVAAVAVADLSDEDTPTTTIVTAPDAPGWLQPLSPEPVAVAPAAVAETPKPAASRPRPAAAPARKRNGGNQALSIMLILLGLLTVLVLAFLIYLLFF